MKITLLTLGARGDVQPYLALGRGLQQHGHHVQVVTAQHYGLWVQQLGLQFAPLAVDIGALLASPAGQAALAGKNLWRWLQKLQPDVVRQALHDSWAAVNAFAPDVIVQHPQCLSGYHLAEKLGCRLCLALPTPLLSPTEAFPSPLLPVSDLGPFNKLSHYWALTVAYGPYQPLINAWRKTDLGLPPTANEHHLRGQAVTRLYAYSPKVLPYAADWDTSTHVTGYWWLERDAQWQPPPALVGFLRAGPPPIYIGFGGMVGAAPAYTTHTLLAVLQASRQRAILASGGGGLKAKNLPPHIFMLEEAPHDWLFPQVAAVVHHGGAGTTGRGLWAGKPTLICPFSPEQMFWGRRVYALGVGPKPLSQKHLTLENLRHALHELTTPAMQQAAQTLGVHLQAEQGIAVAIRLITQ